ncbi:MAG: DUF1848 domain-containing protein [Armatimonadota bacterium]|nr:DUF1848 domain-containing protein [Armatimonadota bacterium]
MEVISASRRTDIPACYADWFMNRVRAGYCVVEHPFSRQRSRVSLLPEAVVAIAFWTRNPAPLLPYLGELDGRGFKFLFNFTVTGYGPELEPAGPDPRAAVEVFRRLSDRLGAALVHWRYDPIVITDEMDPDWHRRHFEALCRKLEGYTHRCVISFLQLYRKNQPRMEAAARAGRFRYGYLPVRTVTPGRFGWVLPQEVMCGLAQDLGGIAAAYGIRVYSCCNPFLVAPLANVHPGRCLDGDLIGALRADLAALPALRPSRPGCGCVAARDLGAYDRCGHGCVYCYATGSKVCTADPYAEKL